MAHETKRIAIIYLIVFIIGIVFMVVMVAKLAMSQSGQTQGGIIMNDVNETDDNNPYNGLRALALNAEQTQEMTDALEGSPVFAAVVDMDVDWAVATLACFADGTVSLYYSSGGGQMGLGQADEEIRTAAIAFLRSAEQVLGVMEKTDTYPLPQNGKHIVYLKTTDGTYMQTLDMETINGESRELQFLNFLYQNVLAKIGAHIERTQ